ncbi:LysM peptidoglycan-binding domain-containing protein [Mongoliitalea daihaiensis]|uniref:LysM peptidoglycan-binding domain-containing protein n=1 Tax=Mongoliitalea daihaiensis TaxID=2782006 RepID=UPI001F2476F8|nr:LysM peptidoglycan-binding domain-containing protein [Mongoliitalea daihaiensis]UJP64762.1 LysM peptidoglycan-binding domain-containing protein [Mongoliitalea daihaiensis]
MKHIILLGLFFSFTLAVHAHTPALLDSIGIEKVGDKTFIIHEVSQGETLFGLSRRYQVAVNDILQSNDNLQDGLKMGARVRVPYISKAALAPNEQIHRVAAGETLFAISRRYNVTVNDILTWNDLQGTDLSVGQALVIKSAAVAAPVSSPVPSATPPATTAPPATTKASNTTTKAAEPVVTAKTEVTPEPKRAATVENTSTTIPATVAGEWISHTVEAGETLYAISRKYEASMNDLITWNNLASNNLQTGQKLKVGRTQVSSEDVPVVKSTVPVKVNNEKVDARVVVENPSNTADTSFKDIREAGLAEVIDGTGNHKKYLVLHRTAPVGTIMRVRNEENDVTIFARVVGKLPDTGDNSRLLIKLSKAAFDQLRAVNSRFPVEISY